MLVWLVRMTPRGVYVAVRGHAKAHMCRSLYEKLMRNTMEYKARVHVMGLPVRIKKNERAKMIKMIKV